MLDTFASCWRKGIFRSCGPDRQQLGSISKQGDRLLRSLLMEAAQTASCCDPGMKKEYLHRCHQKPKGVANVAAVDAAQEDALSRDRWHREQPAGGPGRRKLDR
jgi:transposase